MAASRKKLNYTQFILILFTFCLLLPKHSWINFLFSEFCNNEPLTLFERRKLTTLSRRSYEIAFNLVEARGCLAKLKSQLVHAKSSTRDSFNEKINDAKGLNFKVNVLRRFDNSKGPKQLNTCTDVNDDDFIYSRSLLESAKVCSAGVQMRHKRKRLCSLALSYFIICTYWLITPHHSTLSTHLLAFFSQLQFISFLFCECKKSIERKKNKTRFFHFLSS